MRSTGNIKYINTGLLYNLTLTSACSPNCISAKKLLTAWAHIFSFQAQIIILPPVGTSVIWSLFFHLCSTPSWNTRDELIPYRSAPTLPSQVSLCLVARRCHNLSHAVGAKQLRKVPGFFVNSFHPDLLFCHERVKPGSLCGSQWWMDKALGMEAPVHCVSPVNKASEKSYRQWNKADSQPAVELAPWSLVSVGSWRALQWGREGLWALRLFQNRHRKTAGSANFL